MPYLVGVVALDAGALLAYDRLGRLPSPSMELSLRFASETSARMLGLDWRWL